MKSEHSFCFSLTKFCGNSATKRRPQARARPTLSHEIALSNRAHKRCQPLQGWQIDAQGIQHERLSMQSIQRGVAFTCCEEMSRMSRPRHTEGDRHFRMPGMRVSGV